MILATITGVAGILLGFTKYHLSPAVPILCIISLVLTFTA